MSTLTATDINDAAEIATIKSMPAVGSPRVAPADSDPPKEAPTSSGKKRASQRSVSEERTQSSPKIGPARAAEPGTAKANCRRKLDHGSAMDSNSDSRFMEDRVRVEKRDTEGLFYMGCYDGHGGTETVNRVEKHLHEKILGYSEAYSIEESMRRGFHEMEEIVRHDVPDTSGSCAVVTILDAREADWMLHVANLGDSRAILSKKDGKVHTLTRDHTPSCSVEAARLVEEKVEIENSRLPNGLAVSRAFGNYDHATGKNCKPAGLSSEPECMTIPLEDSDEFILLASDGVFHGLETDKVVKIVRHSLRNANTASQAATALLQAAKVAQSTDNMSATLCVLNTPPLIDNSNSRLRCRKPDPAKANSASKIANALV